MNDKSRGGDATSQPVDYLGLAGMLRLHLKRCSSLESCGEHDTLLRAADALEHQHYADIEHETLGCPTANTGIYATNDKRKFEALDLSAPSESATPTQAAQDVLAERHRQVEKEGWDAEHDDEHADGALGLAGACYAGTAAAGLQHKGGDYAALPSPFRWPWGAEWWKPKNPRRDLVRAGALILAEIERIDRRSK